MGAFLGGVKGDMVKKWRPEWESNPRMTVLQTVVLDHFTIRPSNKLSNPTQAVLQTAVSLDNVATSPSGHLKSLSLTFVGLQTPLNLNGQKKSTERPRRLTPCAIFAITPALSAPA